MWKIGVYIVLIMNILYKHIVVYTRLTIILLVIFLKKENDVDIYFQSLMA